MIRMTTWMAVAIPLAVLLTASTPACAKSSNQMQTKTVQTAVEVPQGEDSQAATEVSQGEDSQAATKAATDTAVTAVPAVDADQSSVTAVETAPANEAVVPSAEALPAEEVPVEDVSSAEEAPAANISPVEQALAADVSLAEETPVANVPPAEETPITDILPAEPGWKGPRLNRRIGTIIGPSGKETYYNLNMRGIVNSIHRKGWVWQDIAAEHKQNVAGDYYIREDGVKMLGNYIMVAANLSVHPRGSLVETSLGTGVVVDTGEFAKHNVHQIDIAVNW